MASRPLLTAQSSALSSAPGQGSRDDTSHPDTSHPGASQPNAGQLSPALQQNLWLCLRFPRLPLYALGVRADESQRLSAVVAGNRVVAVTEALQLAGVCSGMTVSHSRMLVPAIECLERKLSQEQRYLQQLAHWAYRYSPLISPYQHSLLLDIGGCLRLFGGFLTLFELICGDLDTFAIDVLVGIAGTAKAAYVLSHERNNGLQTALSGQFSPQVDRHNLGQATLDSLDPLLISAETIAHLQACGFEYVQDIINIPGVELGQRFGAALLDYLDCLLGTKPDPQAGITPPETFYQQHDFAEPVHNQQWIDQCLSALLRQLCDFLRRRQLHCQGFDWRFYGDKNSLLQTVGITLAAKQNSHRIFKQLTDLQLEKITFRNELMRIELHSDKLLPMRLFPDDFFDPGTGYDEALQLIDKLKTRLGRRAVFQVQISPEHLPELRNRRRPVKAQHNSTASLLAKTQQRNSAGTFNAATKLSMTAEQIIAGEHLSAQPIGLLPEPQLIACNFSGQPCEAADNAAEKTPLQLIHGPDRIVSHWWRNPQRRDYFMVFLHNAFNGRMSPKSCLPNCTVKATIAF